MSYDRRFFLNTKESLREVEWSYLGMEVFQNVFFVVEISCYYWIYVKERTEGIN